MVTHQFITTWVRHINRWDCSKEFKQASSSNLCFVKITSERGCPSEGERSDDHSNKHSKGGGRIVILVCQIINLNEWLIYNAMNTFKHHFKCHNEGYKYLPEDVVIFGSINTHQVGSKNEANAEHQKHYALRQRCHNSLCGHTNQRPPGERQTSKWSHTQNTKSKRHFYTYMHVGISVLVHTKTFRNIYVCR